MYGDSRNQTHKCTCAGNFRGDLYYENCNIVITITIYDVNFHGDILRIRVNHRLTCTVVRHQLLCAFEITRSFTGDPPTLITTYNKEEKVNNRTFKRGFRG